jgi:hypothetical protein
MVKDEAHAERAQEQCQQEDVVRRVAALQDFESGSDKNSQHEGKLAKKSEAVFEQVACCGGCFP